MNITASSCKTDCQEAKLQEILKTAKSFIAKCRDKGEKLDSLHELLLVLVQHVSDINTLLNNIEHVGCITARRLWLAQEGRQSFYSMAADFTNHVALMRQKESIWGDEGPILSRDENVNIQINDLTQQGGVYNTEQATHGDARERPAESGNQSVHESIAHVDNPQRINTQQECLRTNADNPSLLTPDGEPVILSKDDRSTSSGTDCNERRMVHLRLPKSLRKRPAGVANPRPSKFARNERTLRSQVRFREVTYSDDQLAIEISETDDDDDDDDECPPGDEGDVEVARGGYKGVEQTSTGREKEDIDPDMVMEKIDEQYLTPNPSDNALHLSWASRSFTKRKYDGFTVVRILPMAGHQEELGPPPAVGQTDDIYYPAHFFGQCKKRFGWVRAKYLLRFDDDTVSYVKSKDVKVHNHEVVKKAAVVEISRESDVPIAREVPNEAPTTNYISHPNTENEPEHRAVDGGSLPTGVATESEPAANDGQGGYARTVEAIDPSTIMYMSGAVASAPFTTVESSQPSSHRDMRSRDERDTLGDHDYTPISSSILQSEAHEALGGSGHPDAPRYEQGGTDRGLETARMAHMAHMAHASPRRQPLATGAPQARRAWDATLRTTHGVAQPRIGAPHDINAVQAMRNKAASGDGAQSRA